MAPGKQVIDLATWYVILVLSGIWCWFVPLLIVILERCVGLEVNQHNDEF